MDRFETEKVGLCLHAWINDSAHFSLSRAYTEMRHTRCMIAIDAFDFPLSCLGLQVSLSLYIRSLWQATHGSQKATMPIPIRHRAATSTKGTVKFLLHVEGITMDYHTGTSAPEMQVGFTFTFLAWSKWPRARIPREHGPCDNSLQSLVAAQLQQ